MREGGDARAEMLDLIRQARRRPMDPSMLGSHSVFVESVQLARGAMTSGRPVTLEEAQLMLEILAREDRSGVEQLHGLQTLDWS